MMSVRSLTKLLYLSVKGTCVGNRGLQHLCGLGQLEMLELTGSSVNDAGLEYIAGLTQLCILHLGGTDVCDLRPLLKCPRLFGKGFTSYVTFDNPPPHMAKDLRDILAVADKMDRKTQLHAYLSALPAQEHLT